MNDIAVQAEPCKTCPFRKKALIKGSREYLIDVLRLIYHGSIKHSCHRTDPIADGYVGGDKKQCGGILKVSENDRGIKSHEGFFKTWVDFFRYHREGNE